MSPRILLMLCALFSLSMLAVALIGQYVFKLHPCDLCIYQRIPYVVIAAIGVLGAFLVKHRRLQYAIAVICSLLFLLDAGIAGYHTGVELEIFKGPTACSSDSKTVQTIEEIRAAIMNAPLVTCAQAMIYVLGLSMAAWNMIAAMLAFFATSLILFKNRKNKLHL
jgi:disulfide bond formation protein DsbB